MNTFRRKSYDNLKMYYTRFGISEQFKMLSREHIELLMREVDWILDNFQNRFANNEHYFECWSNWNNIDDIIPYQAWYLERKGAHCKVMKQVNDSYKNKSYFFIRKVDETTKINFTL
jgi:hypothetical protein